jgi:hypothetical protein
MKGVPPCVAQRFRRAMPLLDAITASHFTPHPAPLRIRVETITLLIIHERIEARRPHLRAAEVGRDHQEARSAEVQPAHDAESSGKGGQPLRAGVRGEGEVAGLEVALIQPAAQRNTSGIPDLPLAVYVTRTNIANSYEFASHGHNARDAFVRRP